MTTRDRCPACLSQDVALARAGVWGACDLVGCRTCRTEFLAPQPSDERLGQIYGADYYTPWSAEAADTVDAMKRLTFAPMLDACEPAPGRSVLDLGCATGSFLAEAARRGATTYGIDLNPEAIAMARERVPAAHLHVGVVADRPFPDVLLDAVVMIDFIEHVRDPEAELSVVHEITRPGSKLVISTPRVDSSMRSASGRHWPQYREEHLTYFSAWWSRGLAVPHWVLSRRCRTDAQGDHPRLRVRPSRRVSSAGAVGCDVSRLPDTARPAPPHAPGRNGRDDGGRESATPTDSWRLARQTAEPEPEARPHPGRRVTEESHLLAATKRPRVVLHRQLEGLVAEAHELRRRAPSRSRSGRRRSRRRRCTRCGTPCTS